MDLIDDPSSSKLTAVFEIPGIKTNDISLHIRDGCLVVQGERKNPYPKNAQITTTSLNEEMEIEGQSSIKVPIQELRFGTFYRSIRVPSGIKVSLLSIFNVVLAANSQLVELSLLTQSLIRNLMLVPLSTRVC